MIDVAAPMLTYDGVASGVAALEFPVDVLVGPVKVDGVLAGPELLSAFEYVVFRQRSPGGGLDVWDDASKAWYPQGTHAGRSAALAYLPDDAYPWQGMIVAAGGTDAAGAPVYDKAAGGYPRYHVCALFATPDELVLSGPSAPVLFRGSADANRMVMGPGDGEKPDNATEARLLLKNSALAEIGGLHVEYATPGARVVLRNAAGASIVLHPDGHIELAPAPGKGVVVAGDLETERITYRPAGGGGKQVLP